MGQDKFCIIPWIHMVYDSGDFLPCCRMYTTFHPVSIDKNPLGEILNSKNLIKLREDLINGRESNLCRECIENEENGIFSERQKYNLEYREFIKPVRENNKIKIAEEDIVFANFRFSNTCNLKCRTCGPEFSTAWNQDAIKLGQIPSPIIKNSVDKEIPELPSCKQFYFAGGEPLLDKTHDTFLEDLIRNNKSASSQLIYSTNLNIREEKCLEFVEKWKNFKSVIIYVSIDSIEKKKAELIRSGSNLNLILENMNKLMNRTNIQLKIQVTVSKYNVTELLDIVSFFKKNYNLSFSDINLNLLFTPKEFSISTISKESKKKIQSELKTRIKEFVLNENASKEAMLFHREINNILNFMNSESECLDELFIEKNRKLDSFGS